MPHCCLKARVCAPGVLATSSREPTALTSAPKDVVQHAETLSDGTAPPTLNIMLPLHRVDALLSLHVMLVSRSGAENKENAGDVSRTPLRRPTPRPVQTTLQPHPTVRAHPTKRVSDPTDTGATA